MVRISVDVDTVHSAYAIYKVYMRIVYGQIYTIRPILYVYYIVYI
jgi:hypothetical protein